MPRSALGSPSASPAPVLGRRRAIGLVARSAVLLGFAGAIPACSPASRPDLPAQPVGTEYHALGAEYVETFPAEADPERLRELLGIDDPLDPRAMSVWRAAAAADFEAGQTVLLAGWLMARTEGRVAALVFAEH